MPPASLYPVSGDPGAILKLLVPWLEERGRAELSLRTSGSSGEPKQVMLHRSAIRASAMTSSTRIGGPGEWLLALPGHHIAGLQVLTRSAIAGTAPVLLDNHPDLASATRALKSGRRYVSVVPTQLHRWLADRSSARALRDYDAVLVGGASTHPRLLHRAQERGVRVVTSYGMSETAGGCVYDGVPLDGVEFDLDAQGIVRITGPVLFAGYVGRPDLTRAALRDGWFITSDLGRIDDDGRLDVLGRADDVAISGGVNVPLAAVQRRLGAMPELAEVAVVAIPDSEWGERVLAVATLVDGAAEPDLAGIRDFVAVEHPRSWAPRQLVVRDTLPLLESGKVDHDTLRAGLVARR